jgi:hypothetical protein
MAPIAFSLGENHRRLWPPIAVGGGQNAEMGAVDEPADGFVQNAVVSEPVVNVGHTHKDPESPKNRRLTDSFCGRVESA